jgi:hypothetical protein
MVSYLLPILCFLLAQAYGGSVTVEVFDREGSQLGVQSVALPQDTLKVKGDFVMHSLDKKVMPWKYTKMELGERQMTVVIEILGLKAVMPATAWVLTHVSGGSGARKDNVGLSDIEVEEGDTLHWRYWSVADLAKARKAAGPTPTPTPEEDDEEMDDAAVLAKERARELARERAQPREVEVHEVEGGQGEGEL